MKSRFSTYDLICTITELQRLVGLRVNQVYDIDNKTFLIRLQQGENKAVLLFESGIRIHTTAFEWPKNTSPSGFSMKMRKHIRNKRLEKLSQIGLDRIVDMQFGTGEAAYHVILELYDRGNIMLTDYNYLILYILRPHTEGEQIRFAVREQYPSDRGKERSQPPSLDRIREIFSAAKPNETVKKILNPHLVYGPAVLDHVLLNSGFELGIKLGDINLENDLLRIQNGLELAEQLIDEAFLNSSKGYIIQKLEKQVNDECFYSYQEFHPFLFQQYKKESYVEFNSFDLAVDEFFSKLESQKIDMKGLQQELAAVKKLENVKKDHEKRITQLEILQEEDKIKGELITRNKELVDNAIIAIRQLIANQTSWKDIELVVKEATLKGDETAKIIKKLKLDTNNISLFLSDPYVGDEDSDERLKSCLIDVDIDLTAFANAKKYYDQKKQAANKQRKTVESQQKAFKSAEKKTKQTLKEVKTSVTISKARKVFWFEKFYWFISSENYLVIAGRDQQQNELIVKRYLRLTDIYLHAGITGASSVVIKNPTGEPVPPKTLNEAGTMAICYSIAWDAKVVTTCWWVHASQVSKTAPTGEYLTGGSFMIRGKKNFLPQCHLIMGFSFLFKLEESSVERHKGERRKRTLEEQESDDGKIFGNKDDNEVEFIISDEETDGGQNETPNLPTIDEMEETNAYPDTEIIIDHRGNTLEIKIPEPKIRHNSEEENEIVYLGDNEPVLVKPTEQKAVKSKIQSNKVDNAKNNAVNNDDTKEGVEKVQNKNQQYKRGQKAKIKKIKEKYRDQDDEDRELRMKILQPDGPKKEKKKKKNEKKLPAKNSLKNLTPVHHQKNVESAEKLLINNSSAGQIISNIVEEVIDEPEEGEVESIEPTVAADIDMIDSLTGQPVTEDELLFAIPVVAPYNALTNYKYKVKLTPGTGKRGKASKLALNLFLKDKTATQREKDLLKYVKDQDLARNFPGKVKVSAPQLSKRTT